MAVFSTHLTTCLGQPNGRKDWCTADLQGEPIGRVNGSRVTRPIRDLNTSIMTP